MNTALLVLGNVTIVYMALFIALSVRVQSWVSAGFYMQHIVPFGILSLVLLILLYINGLYERTMRHTARHIFNALLQSIVLFTVSSIILFYFFPTLFGLTPKITLALFVIVLFPLLFLLHYYVPKIRKHNAPQALLIGGPEKPYGFEITSIVPPETHTEMMLGAIQGMSNGRVLMSFTDPQVQKILPQLHSMMLQGVMFIDTDALTEEHDGKVNLSHIDELWFLHALHKIDNKMFLFAKRMIDIVMALLLLPLYLVLIPFVWAAIKIEDGKTVFISQERYGRNRQVFWLYKFRTMTVDDEGYWHKSDKNVITKVGAFLRKSRIDELPQLWNILRGDISLIGPRPDMVKFGEALASKIDYYNARYIVRPGLTGWAQVAQSVIPQSIEESRDRLAYDLYYIKNLSLFLELKIILKTVKMLLRKIFKKSE